MVGRSVDGGKAVSASRETSSNIGSEDTVVSLLIQALEENEAGGVGRRRLRKGVELLDDNVGVSGNVTHCIDELRRGKVILGRIHEEASVEMTDGHLNRESGVRLEGTTVRRVDELRGRHVRLRSDDTHGCRVARTTRNLLAVRNGQVGHGEAEVNEVVGRRG